MIILTCILQIFLLFVKFLQDKRKYRKRREKISVNISARLSGSRVTNLKYTNTQKLNCRCQELDPTHFTVSLVRIWWTFTPPNEFLLHPEYFTPNPKNVKNTIIIANQRSKNFTPLNLYPQQ